MATNIPISQVVDVNVVIQNAAVEEQNFNNLLLVTTQNSTPPIIPKAERVRLYSDIDGVINDFGTSSEATTAAQIWFGQEPKPEELLITLRYGSGEAPSFTPSVLGRVVSFASSLSQWQGITDGALRFTYNDVIFTLSNMDFSAVLLAADVVAIVQAILDDIQPLNIQISLTDTADNPVEDSKWTSIVAVTGELTFNYNPTVNDTSFYLASSSTTKNFTDIGTPAYGSDISVSALANLDAGYAALSPVSSGFSSNDFAAVIDFNDYTAIADGSVNINVNAVAADYTGMDFTSATNNQDIAAIIAQRLTNQLGYDVTVGLTVGNTLVIQSLSEDMTITVIAAAGSGTDISTLAFSTPATVTAAGTYLETPPEAIAAATELNNNWYGVALTKEGASGTDVSFANIKLTAGYIQSLTKQYYARLSDLSIATSDTTDQGSTLANFNYTRTVPCFHEDNEYLDVGAAGSLLTTVAGSATLMFKTATGVSGSDVNVNGQKFVINKNVNIHSLIGGVTIIRNGTVSSTQIQFADVIRFVDWLTNEIQIDVYSVLAANDLISYTDTGVNQLKGGVKEALDQGVAQGGIATVIDDNGNVQASYTITAPRVATVPVSQRAARISPDIAFTATLGNAIQKVKINGVVSF